MEQAKRNAKKILRTVGCVALIVALAVSIGFHIYYAFWGFDSYLQSTDEIYVMEAGILYNNLEFRSGEDFALQYDFTHENYGVLKSQYRIIETAGEGSEFEKALRLMAEYAPRLTHKSDYDNHIPMDALQLLEYSLNQKKNGINCRSKAQILNEMCLALGIYARKVWINPYSRYDGDCHVVNEIYDTSLQKWVMLDITNNEYWVDENNTPLSVLEIRSKAALREFCTPIEAGKPTKDLQKSKEKNIGDFLYIVKNMVYMYYCTTYTVGESEQFYLLFPQNLPTKNDLIISPAAIERSPLA